MVRSGDFASVLQHDLEASAGGAMLYGDYLEMHPDATVREVVEMLLDGRLVFDCQGPTTSIHTIAVGCMKRARRG